ncbi:MAG: asparagine synthase-related protein [Bacillota bacterium]|nr:asparagine synthase-related protein [Bacillota bacterium]
MPGLIAIFNDADEAADLDPLIEKVEFRGECREITTGDHSCCMAVLGGCSGKASSNRPAAIDGYMVVSEEEGIVLQGYEGEKKLCSLIAKDGPSCFENIEGEFTLAYSDGDGSRLVARDPLGIKPLYYTEKEGTLYIAPEIKVLVDLDTLIKEVPPGSYLDEHNHWISYYNMPKVGRSNNLSLAEAEEKMRHLLLLAVEERIAGVDNLGLYLSGGLDSSVVAALAAEIREEPISTYTVGIKGSRDIDYASIMAERIGSDHHSYTYDLDEMLAIIPDVIYHLESFDCAYVRSAIPNYIAARQAAADGREVMLTGEGSDEMFVGYSYLKLLGSEQKIEAELEAIFKNLSRTGLQRVDRMNSAHGLECRVPFLKPALLELVQQFPMEWKLHDFGSDSVDKWILRKAFEEELGAKIAWRDKEQFDQGSGSAGMLTSVAEEIISDAEFAAESEEAPVPVRNKEELYYYRIFRGFYPESVLPLVGRWTRTS